jgi:rod shape determining protein RodA
VLVAATAALTAYGLLVVASASGGPTQDRSLVVRQALFVAVGAVAMGTVSMVDYRRARHWAVGIYLCGLAALVAVLTPLGTEVKATKGWFQVGGVSVQPAELVKLALIVALAAVLSGRGQLDRRGRVVVSLAVAGVVSLLVLAQGEVGSVLVYAAVTLAVMVAAGVPRRYLLGLCAVGALGAALVLTSGILKEYQQARLTSFMDLEADAQGTAYNQRQSVTAVGSGGLLGKGLFDGPQTQLNYVPEQHTDFIFTVVGEELGFVGGVLLLGLYSTLLVRVYRIAQVARDDFGSLLCVGVGVMLLFQVFQNVGMNLGIMPITGIPLPLISYGGSSLLTTLAGLGLVSSVSAHRFRGSPFG